VNRALVLGGGGVAGTAWMLGLASGLHRHGVELGDADRVVGTSAGAIVGALIALGRDPDEVADRPRPRTGAHLANLTHLLGTTAWPARLEITVTDAASGERQVLDRWCGWELPLAVAASTAYPGAFPAVVINDRTWIDGGMRSTTNADLASGADRLLLVEPLAHLVDRQPVHREVAVAAPGKLVHLAPDAAGRRAFGATVADLHDPARWSSALEEGRRQGATSRDEITAQWLA
jgi:NTE family protein